MIDGSVARRYARALLDAAAQDGRHEKVSDELSAVATALSRPEARAVLANPSYTAEQRRSLVGAVAKAAGASPVLQAFLNLLIDRERIASIDQIARVYRERLDEKVGRVRALVTSATPLDDGQLFQVREALAAATLKSVAIEQKTDPSILGGLVAEVGGKVYDGSLKTQLERLRDELKQAPL